MIISSEPENTENSKWIDQDQKVQIYWLSSCNNVFLRLPHDKTKQLQTFLRFDSLNIYQKENVISSKLQTFANVKINMA